MKDRILAELTVFALLLVAGVILLPGLIYLVGKAIFGDYGPGGLLGFYAGLQAEFRAGEPVVWFLLLSPYLLWQALRLTVLGFRRLRPERAARL